MPCPCCEIPDDVPELQPGDNHTAHTAGTVAYPRGPWHDRQRHARLAKQRGAATRTTVADLPLYDYIPVFMASRGPITYVMDGTPI